ncbi:hypothetical protein SFV1gp13 [Sulfolobus filamentous virus 1]|uniref:Uncharacterized protein n=1 Tax=Sulfolobus filamentous virus 1 TaxID=2304198 RepID=A0A346LU52_SUFV1|nr:hypothetical protein HOT91_gp13 [Sulfolobus filamentous virus 1]AXQ00095.1 hypothetical protein SFV1gp13 [Sulfolobus filamentous virus 1]
MRYSEAMCSKKDMQKEILTWGYLLSTFRYPKSETG